MLTNGCIEFLNYLRKIYAQTEDVSYPFDTKGELSKNTVSEIESIIEFLNNEKYISFRPYTDGGGNIKLTQKGLHYEDYESKESNVSNPVFNFNAPVSNSPIGTIGNVTMNIGISYDEMRSNIHAHDMEPYDKELALKLIDYIETLTDNDAAMKKGCLSKFSDLISKHSWIPSLIGSALIKYFIG